MSDYYNAKPVYKFKILESDGSAIVNVPVKLCIVGKEYTLYTNNAGEGSLKLNLKPGSYPVTVKYGIKSLSKNIKLFSSRGSVKNLCSIYGTPVQ